jgi:hypothetical protein
MSDCIKADSLPFACQPLLQPTASHLPLSPLTAGSLAFTCQPPLQPAASHLPVSLPTADCLPFACQPALQPTAHHLPVSTADSLHQRKPAGLSAYLYSQHPGISCQLALQPTAYHLYVCLVTADSLTFDLPVYLTGYGLAFVCQLALQQSI